MNKSPQEPFPSQTPYLVHRTPGNITIDGHFKEDAWKKASALNFLVCKTHEKPLGKTEAKILWDKEFLYVGFDALDKDVWSYLTQRDSQTCLEDCLEIFFKTVPTKAPFYNFEINALGTIFDAFSPGKAIAGGYRRWSKWNCEGIQVAVNIRGTLNDHTDVDEGWGLEVAIPFRSLPSLEGKSPRAGDSWLFHLARYDYSVYLPGDGMEISSTALITGAFYDYEEWQSLVFTE